MTTKAAACEYPHCGKRYDECADFQMCLVRVKLDMAAGKREGDRHVEAERPVNPV